MVGPLDRVAVEAAVVESGVPEQLVSQATGQAVPRDALAAAAPAPLVRLHEATGQYRLAELKALPGHHQAELVEAGERQVRDGEGSVGHVEVFRMAGVEPPSSEDLAPHTPATTRQPPFPDSPPRDYTVVCEEIP
jgi:hypothetical protein